MANDTVPDQHTTFQIHWKDFSCDLQREERQHGNLPIVLDVRRAEHDVVFDGRSGDDGIARPKIVG